MSGYLPHSSSFAISPGLESMPVFHRHGKSDPLVWPNAVRESCDLAISKRRRGRMDYRRMTYLNLGYLVSPGKVLDGQRSWI
jgi:hypothetical protein